VVNVTAPIVDIGTDGALEQTQGTGLGNFHMGRDNLGGKPTIPRTATVPVVDNRDQTITEADNEDQGIAVVPE